MRRAAGIRAQIAALNESKGRIELVGKVIGAAAVEGERRDGGERVLLAHEPAKTGLHAPDSDQRASRHTVAAFDGIEECRILRLHALAARDDRRAAALVHELRKGELEALLSASARMVALL